MSAGGTTWRFIRQHFVRIVIGAVLVAAVSVAVFVWMPYQREQRIAPKRSTPPAELPQKVEPASEQPSESEPLSGVGSQEDDSFRFNLTENDIPSDLLRSIDEEITFSAPGHISPVCLMCAHCISFGDEALAFVEKRTIRLNISRTQVTDSGLKNLAGLTHLEWLNLCGTHVTDVGLEHLKGLTNLSKLNLRDTKTTAKGRAMLRKALPNCRIYPDP